MTKNGSCTDKSVIHSVKGAPRISTAADSSRNMANKIGIVSNIGRHPLTGLAPCFLYSSMVSCCIFCLAGSVAFRCAYRA